MFYIACFSHVILMQVHGSILVKCNNFSSSVGLDCGLDWAGHGLDWAGHGLDWTGYGLDSSGLWWTPLDLDCPKVQLSPDGL